MYECICICIHICICICMYIFERQICMYVFSSVVKYGHKSHADRDSSLLSAKRCISYLHLSGGQEKLVRFLIQT